MKRSSQNGFTIIELMIATSVFAIILLGATTATIQIGRLYYKGVIMSRVQQTARRVMDTVSQPIQFGGSSVRLSSPKTQVIGGIETGAICIGNKRFTYGINAQVTPGVTGYTANHKAAHALYEDQLPGNTSPCTILDLTQPLPAGKDHISENMRLARFDITPPTTNNIWAIDMLLIYGDDDLLVPNGNSPTGCKGQPEGSQWCATAALSTKVYKRID